MSAYIKSVLWLVGCGGLGYALFLAAVSSAKDQDFVKKYNLEKDDNKRTLTSVLDSAANSNKPLYRMSKEEIDNEIKK